jgi:hypothetical protein
MPTFTPDETARLRAARTEFAKRTQGLTPQQLRARLNAMAGTITLMHNDNPVGGRDPFVASLARQTLAGMDANERIEAAQAELDQIGRTDLNGHRPRDPDFKGRVLARKHELEQAILGDMARVISIAEDNHSAAQQEAVALYRQQAAEQAKMAAIRVAAKRMEAERAAAAIEKRAAALVAGRRLAAGKEAEA